MSSEVEKRRLGIEQKQRRPSIQIVANVLRQSQTQQLTSLSLESPAVNLDSVAEDGSAAEAGPANEESSPLIPKTRSVRSLRNRYMLQKAVQTITSHDKNRNNMFRDGKVNVVKDNVSLWYFADLYFHLLELRWHSLLAVSLAFFILLALPFAALYYAAREGLCPRPQNFSEFYFQAFSVIASFETPFRPCVVNQSFLSAATAVWALYLIQGFVALTLTALIIGIVIERISRPHPRIVFSRNAIITSSLSTPHNNSSDGSGSNKRHFVLRVTNERLNEIMDCEFELYVFRLKQSPEGIRIGLMERIPIENKHFPVLQTTLIVRHEITEDSPLAHATGKTFYDEDIAIWVKMACEDGTFHRRFTVMHCYSANTVVFGGRFVDAVVSLPAPSANHSFCGPRSCQSCPSVLEWCGCAGRPSSAFESMLTGRDERLHAVDMARFHNVSVEDETPISVAL